MNGFTRATLWHGRKDWCLANESLLCMLSARVGAECLFNGSGPEPQSLGLRVWDLGFSQMGSRERELLFGVLLWALLQLHVGFWSPFRWLRLMSNTTYKVRINPQAVDSGSKNSSFSAHHHHHHHHHSHNSGSHNFHNSNYDQ